MDYRLLHGKTVAQLRAMAREEKIKIPAGASKAKIVALLLEVETRRAAELALRQAEAQRSAEQKLAERQIAQPPVPEEPKKRRGRPPKAKDAQTEEQTAPAPKRRGRPPKKEQEENAVSVQEEAIADQPAVLEKEAETVPPAEIAAEGSASGAVEKTEAPAPESVLNKTPPVPVRTYAFRTNPPVRRQTDLSPRAPQQSERIAPDSRPHAPYGRPFPRQPEQTERTPGRAYEPRQTEQTERTPGRAYEPRQTEQAERMPGRAYEPRQTEQTERTPGRAYEPQRPEQPRYVRRDYVPQDPNDVTQAVSDLLAAGDCAMGHGVLEPMPDGYGFLRAENYQQGPKDVYVSAAQIRRFNLRMGDLVVGRTRPQREGDRYTGLLFIDSVNGDPPEKAMGRPRFEDLTPVYPQRRIRLETAGKGDMALRVIDLLAPIGRGQRALIVSQPKAGKTVLLKKIANAITENEPDIELIVLLIDERPEEVTDMQRSIKGDVVYSTFDEVPENHTQVAEMALERAQRLVEQGKDVVILLDSITRLARAYNLVVPPTGRTLSGGLDPGALHKPKRFFGAARNIENGGSLTIIATALVETGSRMDDIIFEEFKGTGNSEIHLDRRLSEKRIFPAIDMNKSGTRRDDLLLTPEETEGALAVRRMLSGGSNQDAVEQLLSMLHKTQTNADFFQILRGYFAQHEKDGFTYGGR